MANFEEGRIETAARFCFERQKLCLAIAVLASVLALAFVIGHRSMAAEDVLVVVTLVILALVPLGLGIGYEFHLAMEKIFPVNDEEAKS